MARRTRVSLFLSAVVAALLCFAAFSAMAFGAYGDSPASAFPLSGDAAAVPPVQSYIGLTLTTSLAPIDNGCGEYYFRVQLSAGETLKAEFTSTPTTDMPDGANLKALMVAQDKQWDPDPLSLRLTHLTFTAPKSDMYTVQVETSALGTFTVAPVIEAAKIVPVVPVKPTLPVVLTAPLASGKPNHKTAIKFKGSVSPGHTARVTVTMQRKVGTKWKKYKTYSVSTNAAGTWSFNAKLPAATFRLQATTPAITATTAIIGYRAGVSAWRSVKVK